MKRYKPRSNTLVVLKDASFGGPTSSLINLLTHFCDRGETLDVFLMDHNGARTEEVAGVSNLLPPLATLMDSITPRKNLKASLQYIHRLAFALSNRLFGAEKTVHRLYAKSARCLSGLYKNVIAYQEAETSDFAGFIDAPNRISFMHTDFNWICNMCPRYAGKSIYDRYHHVACVTQASADAMRLKLDRDASSVHVVRNTLLASSIIERSQESVAENEERRKPFLLVSIGRLNPEKAFVRIPRVAKKLCDAGFAFDWYIIGDGVTRDEIQNEINSCGVSDTVRLLGFRSNPYRYIRLADCLVITSTHEAQPMVANEALILDTPVISTKFASVYEVIRPDVNGTVVSQDEDALFEAISTFLSDASLRGRWLYGARAFKYDNDQELESLRTILLT